MKTKSVGVLTLLVLSSCGLLEKSDDRPLPAGAFRGTAAIRAQTIPLPVEIANDIARITETGEVVRVNSVPEPTLAPAAVPPEVATPDSPLDVAPSGGEPVVTQHPLTGRRRFSSTSAGTTGGPTVQYTIKNGDTLMKIAFEKYGNVYRWREIYNSNRNVIKDYNLIYPNQVLTIHGVQYMVIEKNGQPYLIRRGDSLKSISQKIYGTPDRWKEIQSNNPQLIRNPRSIYAGFTIYYRPTSSEAPTIPVREAAAEQK